MVGIVSEGPKSCQPSKVPILPVKIFLLSTVRQSEFMVYNVANASHDDACVSNPLTERYYLL
jgi:hypothetical protein